MPQEVFDAAKYLELRPDVAAAGYTTDTAIQHYNQFGEADQAAAEAAGTDYLGAQAWSTYTPLSEQMTTQVNNPVAATNTEVLPTLQTVQEGEEISNISLGEAPTVSDPTAVTAGTGEAATATATTVDPTNALAALTGEDSTYEATTVLGDTPQANTITGVVDPMATVKGQLDSLYADLEFGEVPAWSRGAVNAAEEIMAARGLGASSIGASAITQAIQDSSINIAAADAATYFQMDIQNLQNAQQTELTNTQLRQQSLLSDQAAVNAAKNFNASSALQLQTFQSELIAQIETHNSSLVSNMESFNAGQMNQMEQFNLGNQLQAETFNEQQKLAVESFNASMVDQRDQFNANMQFAIEQSNANWRRNINTANTAATNAAQQVNAQNLFNMSQTAQSNLWQAWRDEASWAFQASESAAARELSLVMAANEQEFASGVADDANTAQLWQSIGSIVANGIFK